MRIKNYGLLIFVWTSLFFPSLVWAQNSILAQLMQAKTAVVEVKAQTAGLVKQPTPNAAFDPKTGRVLVIRNAGVAAFERRGAGVIIHQVGIIATNAHTIAQAAAVQVTLPDGTAVPAQILRFNSSLDLCLLKIAPPYPLTTLALVDSNDVKLGDEIFTIGTSAINKDAISGGIIIGLGTNRSSPPYGGKRNDLFQTTINLYEGDSGGPLFDKKGRLIGLMTAKERTADHSSFAIPANSIAQYLIDYLNELKAKNEQPPHHP